MKIKIISIFPEIFASFVSTSLIEKSITKGLVSIEAVNLRDFADPPHFHVDDTPYGGGAGMVLKPEPLARAIEKVKTELPKAPVILLSASGEKFTQRSAEQLAKTDEIIFVCGRYEGVDQRVIDLLIDREISIGDYVLMGGEVAAMVVMESVIRLVDNVLGNPDSIVQESFTETDAGTVLEGPQYTRPPVFREQAVPEVLLSGDHKRISQWRSAQGLEKTKQVRPALLKEGN